MTKTEIAHLLTLCAAFDYRTIGEADVLAWQEALADIAFEDAKPTVINHYRESTDRIQVAHVRAGVRKIRRERLHHADATFFPSSVAGSDPAVYQAEYRSHCQALADGSPQSQRRPELVRDVPATVLHKVFRSVQPAYLAREKSA